MDSTILVPRSTPTPTPTPTPKRSRVACDACRQRKVRCHANANANANANASSNPSSVSIASASTVELVLSRCANCTLASLQCAYKLPRRKRGPKRAGVSPTPQSPSPASAGGLANAPAPGLGGGCPSGEESSAMLSPLDHIRVDSSPTTTSISLRQPSQFSPQRPRASPVAHEDGLLQSESWSLTPLEIQRALLADIESLGTSLPYVATQCIALSVQIIFPICPMLHIQGLAASVPLLSQPLAASSSSSTGFKIEEIRVFALITALCSTIFACCPEAQPILPGCDRPLISRHFLKASRRMLSHFHDRDIRHPTSDSLAIRMLQSSTLHTLGETQLSLFILGCANQLALLMRLFDKESLRGLEAREAQKRQNIFISLYIADKSASVLNNVPSVMHRMCFDSELTVLDSQIFPDSEMGGYLLEGNMPLYDSPLEGMVHKGFFLSYQLWSMAADIIMDMKILARVRRCSGATSATQASDADNSTEALMDSYMEFCGILDSLPPWLLDPESHTTNDAHTTVFQRKLFWIQRANLTVTFHCLRLTLLQRAAEYGCCYLLGLTNTDSMFAHRKVEVARDLVLAATSMPFEALQANGEPCVEKLRQAGIELLEIHHKTSSNALSKRAKSILSELLNVIARLDSRVSDNLGETLV
ncbi:hypothetical protein BKA61DRAFT_672798 [Leptodontidium sp. MPI-SDFR-AT-0119]|nr:hypothetical protein BKA61DRAFT_672798 [Leptodontidium sp. MPI-SDFR-AT-0119]